MHVQNCAHRCFANSGYGGALLRLSSRPHIGHLIFIGLSSCSLESSQNSSLASGRCSAVFIEVQCCYMHELLISHCES